MLNRRPRLHDYMHRIATAHQLKHLLPEWTDAQVMNQITRQEADYAHYRDTDLDPQNTAFVLAIPTLLYRRELEGQMLLIARAMLREAVYTTSAINLQVSA